MGSAIEIELVRLAIILLNYDFKMKKSSESFYRVFIINTERPTRRTKASYLKLAIVSVIMKNPCPKTILSTFKISLIS